MRKGRQGRPEGSHHFRRDSRCSCLLLPAPGKRDGKTKLSGPVTEHHPAGAAPLSCPRPAHSRQHRAEPRPRRGHRAGLRRAPRGSSRCCLPPQPAPDRGRGRPAALPGTEGLLAAQAQEAASQQQAAQRRGQGDDSPHGALGSGARRSYGRPIVFKGGCGEGEAAMAATGSLRSAPRPQPCAAAISPHLPARRGRRSGPVRPCCRGVLGPAGVRAAPGRPVLPACAAGHSGRFPLSRAAKRASGNCPNFNRGEGRRAGRRQEQGAGLSRRGRAALTRG